MSCSSWAGYCWLVAGRPRLRNEPVTPPGVRESGENPELTRSGEGDGRGIEPLDLRVWEGVSFD